MPRKVGQHQSRTRRAKYLSELPELILKEVVYAKIAKKYNITEQQVKLDAMKLKKEWTKQAEKNSEEARQMQIEKLQLVQAEAWKAYEKSLKSQTKHITGWQDTQFGRNEKDIKQTINSSGDPRYLAIINDCIEKTAKLKGLNAPEKQEITADINNTQTVQRVILEIPDNARTSESK